MKKYYLGLDIGTDSVGYAVTDKEYSLMKFHGEPMWGVHLFDAADLNTKRRAFRIARRRLDRRQQRVSLLQELFAKEIGKVDENFFIRLQCSNLYREEVGEEGTLFNPDCGYSDKQYHAEYPTIHHLICELMTSEQPHDVRLLYLACAWLITHRGHFLSEISMDHISELTDFTAVYRGLVDYLNDTYDSVIIPWAERNPEIADIGAVLQKRNTITGKYRSLCNLLFGASKAPKDVDSFPFNLDVLLHALCGSSIKASELFKNEAYAEIESFSLDSDDEKLASVMSQLGDDALLIEKLKAIFDWALLADSLDGFRTISEAKVEVYNQHKTDLALLKRILRKYAPDKFNSVLRSAEGDNYSAYSGHCMTSEKAKLKKVGKEKFSDYLKKVINSITPEEEDQDVVEDIQNRLALRTFLPKQKDTDNRVIPHQLYFLELNEILSHAQTYLPFLNEADEAGITVSEKIKSVFTFKIPYYVGPLNPYNKDHAWVVFKPGKQGRILPWNFSDMVDEDASEQKFINRMLNKCTYLPDKTVLPKDSLLYHKFTVLNEINNLEIDGIGISVAVKQAIYNDLFMKRRKVTVSAVRNYLISNGVMTRNQLLGGIDETIKSDLKPWLDFHRLMESGTLTEKQVESIIEHRAYAEEKSRFVRWLKKEYAFLSEEDKTYISKLNYKDFGRLSRAFLTELAGTEKNQNAGGEASTIISAMWNTNCNLMELLSDSYTFRDTVTEIQKEYYSSRGGSLNDRLDDMYISNAVKRPVIRALEIVKEVVKAVGNPPEKIFVEMARGGKPEQKGKRTKSRKDQILELYDKCRDEDVRLLRQQLENLGIEADTRLQGDRLFLYFMQLGKCMYSGEDIDITGLKDGTYNIEHIYPQAYVKDDSILNNEILVKSELNGEKSDIYPIQADIRHKMAGFWGMLHGIGLITDEKYKRLTRSTPFTADEKMGFINRQLTETSQSTKAVASILKDYYPETDIVYVKARLTSEFRQEFDLLKSRAFNDLHHAKDAYLNIVTGNVYDMKFSKKWFSVDSEYSLKTKTLFKRPLICNGETVWDGEQMLGKVKKTVSKNTAHMTKYAFCRHGGFFDQMAVKAAPGLVPIKKGLPTEQYGGYNKPAVSFFILTKYRAGKKNDIMVMPVELLHSEEFLTDQKAAEDYALTRIAQILGKKIDEVSFPLGLRILRVNTILSLNGFRVCIAGCGSGGKSLIAAPFVPFKSDSYWETYIKRLESLSQKATDNPNYVFDPEYDKVSLSDNERLYDLYVDKLEHSIYQKRPNNPVSTFVTGKTLFVGLSAVEQAHALLNLHQVFGRVSGGCDLTSIGGAARAAATVNFSSNMSNWKKLYTDVRIIDSSASGLWEKQSDNLLDLL